MNRNSAVAVAACAALTLFASGPGAAQSDSSAPDYTPTSIYPRMGRDFSGIIWNGFPGELARATTPQRAAPAGPRAAPAGPRGDAAAIEALINRMRFPEELISILQPDYRELLEKIRTLSKAKNEAPAPDASCHPYEMPGDKVSTGAGFQFLINPQIVLIIFESGQQQRIVYMDQEHPKNLRPRWLGHSVGKWDGDTLVVDTIGYNDLNTLTNGVFHTTNLHTVERYRLADVGRRLEGKIVYEDPGSLTKPYEINLVFTPEINQEVTLAERSCQDYNNRPVPMASEATAGKG